MNDNYRGRWLTLRRSYMGSSDVAGVLGIAPYSSPRRVWMEKVRGELRSETLPMRLGRHMEPFIANEWSMMTGTELNEGHTTIRGAAPWAGCTPDYTCTLAGVPTIIECKNVGFWNSSNFGTDGSGYIPDYYRVQLAWQIMVTQCPLAILVALVDNREIRQYPFTIEGYGAAPNVHVISRAEADDIWTKVKMFWHDYVEPQVMPPITGADADTDDLREARSMIQDAFADWSDTEHEPLLKDLRIHRERESSAANGAATAANAVKERMALLGVSAVKGSGLTVKWLLDKNGRASFRVSESKAD